MNKNIIPSFTNVCDTSTRVSLFLMQLTVQVGLEGKYERKQDSKIKLKEYFSSWRIYTE